MKKYIKVTHNKFLMTKYKKLQTTDEFFNSDIHPCIMYFDIVCQRISTMTPCKLRSPLDL